MASVTTASIITILRGIIKDLEITDGRNAFVYATDSSFKLDSDRVSSTGMKVYKNGTELSSDDWAYNSDTNKVTITIVTSGVTLIAGDNIIVTFNYFGKYSDTELQSYIKSNLVRFTQRQYKKRFYMSSSNEVVTDNGDSPTRSEGDIIAIITAIDIDPQNVKIKTKDFEVSPSETKSKSEQISDVIGQFTKSYGVIEYLEQE